MKNNNYSNETALRTINPLKGVNTLFIILIIIGAAYGLFNRGTLLGH